MAENENQESEIKDSEVKDSEVKKSEVEVTEDITVDTETKKNLKLQFWYGLLFGVLAASIFFTGLLLWYRSREPKKITSIQLDADADISATGEVLSKAVMSKMNSLLQAIDLYYLNDVTEEDLVNGMYSGLLDALNDPYSKYYTAEELTDLMQQTQGTYFGIGAYVGFDKEQNTAYISKIMKGTPAEASDLKQGDFIVGVDEIDTVGMSSTEVVTYIKGEKDTAVTLKVYRKSTDETLNIEIIRNEIETPTVEHEMLDNNIGYLEILEFDNVTTDQFKKAYTDLKSQGMDAMILDLRANPGGNVGTVCEIAREMLPEGLIVYTEDKYGNRTDYRCNGKNKINIPLVVLVDQNSASAAEILAGAIKDHEVGILMGATTFGKGIVQRIISISDGTAMKLTISKYYTPNGNNIHGIGIEPDIKVEWDEDAFLEDGTDSQKNAAYDYLVEQLQK